jgi:hypothetical protein
MSSEALAWAFKQDCKSSSVKFTLVALCECANYRTGRITPSIDHLCEITGQNRKTIISNITELERQGLLADTGERVGRTRQIKVYQTVTESIPKTEQSLERNSSETGQKQSQKRDTEPSREPSNGFSNEKPSAREKIEKPIDVSEAVWRDFKRQRKKPVTDTALRGIKREADKAGWTLQAALEEATTRGWESFKADWVKDKGNGNGIRQGSGAGPDKRSGLARAIDSELGSLSAFP